jgi:hypothetical protein
MGHFYLTPQLLVGGAKVAKSTTESFEDWEYGKRFHKVFRFLQLIGLGDDVEEFQFGSNGVTDCFTKHNINALLC